jgi:16S rRNA (guanine966-N2)-methyltransferase
VVGRRVLDLFAGTGALGLEALSRGADSATFVERARPALAILRRNCADLELSDRLSILAAAARPALARLAREAKRFDLILIDPPYAGEDWTRLAKEGQLVDILAPDAIVLVERDRRSEPAEQPKLERKGSKFYGETAFDWYERAPAERRGAE